jgi:CRP-like cAMP-binding protein
MKVLDLPQETVLFETGDTIETVYFPLSGVVSLVVDLANGDMIEAAVIGRDSLLGGSAAFDNQVSLNRVVVQVAGAAAALNANRFRELAQQKGRFALNLPAMSSSFLLKRSNRQPATLGTRSKHGCAAGCSDAMICSRATIFRLLRSAWLRCWGCAGRVSRLWLKPCRIRG